MLSLNFGNCVAINASIASRSERKVNTRAASNVTKRLSGWRSRNAGTSSFRRSMPSICSSMANSNTSARNRPD